MPKSTRRSPARKVVSASDPEIRRRVAEFWSAFDPPEDPYVADDAPPLSAHEAYLRIYGRPLGGATRQTPRQSDKNRIRSRQEGRCLYCDQAIGSLVLRRGVPVELRPAWDHFVPYVYARRNSSDNWVLACHLCNSIKHGKIFETVVEAQQLINRRRAELRIESIDLDLQRRIRALAEEE